MERFSEQDDAVGDAASRSNEASTREQNNPIPLSVFEGTLRRVNLTTLTPLQRRVFDYAFPVFSAKPTLNDPSTAAVERGEKVEAPYNYRRFAGGGELPRGCYSSVCDEGSRADDDTLVHELIFYADAERSGEFYVFGGCDPRVTGEDPTMLGEFPAYRPHPESIVVAFQSRAGFPHPLVDRWANPLGSRRACAEFRATAPKNERAILLEVPTTIETVRLENLFDLRRPESQQWLNRVLRDRTFLACFLYTEPFAGIPIVEERPVPADPAMYNFNYLPPTAKYRKGAPIPPEAVVSFALRTGPRDGGNFTDLLPMLMCPGRGGSPVTEAIGTMLRMAGARGLIYPSARNDVFCVFDQEKVVHHHGWCLVDYSAFEFARLTARFIMDPHLWRCVEHQDLYVMPPEDPHAGSWKILGALKHTEQRHRDAIEKWYETQHRKSKVWWRRALRRVLK